MMTATRIEAATSVELANGFSDFRTNRKAVPFVSGGNYFDSFTHAMQVERWILGGVGVPTPEEVAAESEAKRIKFLAQNQPGQPDNGRSTEVGDE
jgi:hypothetical protein